MTSTKFPTFLGLFFLTILLTGLFFIFPPNQISRSQVLSLTTENITPLNIEIVNIEENSATLIWQTTTPILGKISFGKTPSLGNNQKEDNLPKTNHLIKLLNLSPNTQYYFQIKTDKSGSLDSQKFSTAPKKISTKNQPLIGRLLDPNLKPIENALVILKIPNSSIVATQTTADGNFILPLNKLYTSNLSKEFIIKEKLSATLDILFNNSKSQAKILLPQKPNQPLPPLIIGQNYDLTQNSEASPSASKLTSDLNLDGEININDLSTLLKNIEKKDFDQKADLNQDNKVDKKDIEILKRKINSATTE